MKKVLLIAGGGTLGRYTAKELLRLGHSVDIICLEDKVSDNPKIRYYKGNATYDFLKKHFFKNRYDGIVNFIHYENVEDYKPIHRLLIENTEHLIFLSSYRVYDDLQRPVTESTPMLLDTSTDEEFLRTEKYALSKAKAEKFLSSECVGQNFTVVRPVISFSNLRFDLFTHSGDYVIQCARDGKPVLLPECAKKLTAGLDWAGNSGKLIANLLFKKETIGQAYTVSSAQNLKWGEVADIYAKLLGVKIQYISTEDYIRNFHSNKQNSWQFYYDRMFDRVIDNSKILKATGLSASDFLSIEDGLKTELSLL